MASLKKKFWFVFYQAIIVLLLFIVSELAVRIFFPQINYQGTQKSLFMEDRFNKTVGLVPNSSGKSFGQKIQIDEYGFRQMNTPNSYDKSWLFLGDSVTFGVGVNQKQIFPQLIQNEFQQIKVWNTAVVGYSALNYLDVLEVFLEDYDNLEKVVLFFTLNDVYGNFSLKPKSVSVKAKVISFLISNSKLVLLTKKVFMDRSKTYALYDIGLYKENNSSIDRHLNTIVNIKSKLDKSNIDFVVVILPYEYQLRVEGLKAPQDLLNNFFAEYKIESVDLYKNFTQFNSEDYFLYGDPMHLSSLGHEIVASKMIEIFEAETRIR